MLDRRLMNAANRRFRAAASELRDAEAAAEALSRMAHLWAWSLQVGRPLDLDDLDEAIWTYNAAYPDGHSSLPID